VQRKQSVKLMPSPEKEGQIEKEVAAQLGQLMRELNSGELDEKVVSNAGEVFLCLYFLLARACLF
jgi:carbon monoxide dehydrogenase subunit G